jgi:hypothetical protein
MHVPFSAFTTTCEARPLRLGEAAPHDGQQTRALLSEQSLHGSNAHSHSHSHSHSSHHRGPEEELSVSTQQLPGFGGGGGPGFGGEPAFGVGGGFGGRGSPQWINTAGMVVGGIDYTVGVGTQLLAPVVNGIASNVPLMVPALNGECLRGRPVFIPQVNALMCVVGNGAQVTNYLFSAANVLINAAGRGVGLVGQFAGRH